ncbi:MAG: hypothetical protein HQ526_00975, partial [Actinobacteria bacterium]|nr:hypothetical protein [Actinomycetota bacterium]
MTEETSETEMDVEQSPAAEGVENVEVFVPPSIGGVASIVQWWATSTGATSATALPVAVTGENLVIVYDQDETPNATAAAIAGLLTGRDAPATTTSFVGSDGLLDHGLWMAQCAATRDEMTRLREFRNDARAIREAVDPDLGALVDRLASVGA